MMKFEKTMGLYSQDSVGYTLNIFQKNHKNYFNSELAECGLNLIQAVCLMVISENKQFNQKDLADELHLTKGAITKSIKKLEKEGWITRKRLPEDKRNYILELTKKGESAIPKFHEIKTQWESKMNINELSDEFIETLKNLSLKSVELNTKLE